MVYRKEVRIMDEGWRDNIRMMAGAAAGKTRQKTHREFKHRCSETTE
jgi:hypothetical protein